MGYNSYDDHEHWFGYKFSLPAAPTEKFHTIRINLQQPHRSTRTVSLNACFHLNSTTAHAYITSPLLISAGPHKTHAVIKKGKPI